MKNVGFGGCNSGFSTGWQLRVKEEAWEKIDNSLLMHGCASGDIRFITALLVGFWDFVDRFPAVIRGTFQSQTTGLSPKFKKFLARAAPRLSGTLAGMEKDERNHHFLWVSAAEVIGFDEQALSCQSVVPEIDRITTEIDRAMVLEKLLAFVAVEIVAEGISNFLCKSPVFVEKMGQRGMMWFNTHIVHPEDGTTHEDIAYNTASELYRASGVVVTEKEVNGIIQKYVDLFINGAEACRIALVK